MDINKKTIKLTPDGLKTLQDELKELKEIKLPQVVKRVATAREFGDLSENAEYHSAREDHAWIQGRIEEIEDILTQSEVVTTNNNTSSISMGHQVVVTSKNGQELEFHIVGEWEADPMAKKISHESPLGKALIGKKIGDTAEVEAPAGVISYTIKAIR